ncbi:MAG: DNA-binding protein [Verrucomicrobiales bacterium]|nr:DNA-binding protein [Verrucomicrobiales bacterium]
MSKTTNKVIPIQQVESLIYLVRGQKVVLDKDLGKLYEVETRVLNQAVRRNMERFPADFMFVLTREEIGRISQTVTSSDLKFSKSVFAFTEQGVAMLSTVLKSSRAIHVNIEIMRAFVRLRQMLASDTELSKRLNDLEKKYDHQFKIVFDAIRELMSTKTTVIPDKREIGFHTAKPKSATNRSKALSRI